MPLRHILLMVLLLGGSTAHADDDLPSAQDLADNAARRFPQPVRVGDLVGRRVLQPVESAPTVARVRAIVKRKDGTIDVVMDYGGWLGFFARRIAVPVNAMVLLGPVMEIVDYQPDELQNFSPFRPAGTVVLAPDSVIKVGLAKPSH